VGVELDEVCVEVELEDCALDGLDELPVEDDVVDGIVFVEVDVEFAVPALAELLVPEVLTGAVHHLVVKVVVVLPVVCDPVTVTGGLTVTGGVTMVGFELVAVFDELWVLAVPPLIVGSTLIMGWMLIEGATVTV